ncbi:MAG: type 4a pilus biogenesis protein PilO [Kofleriaceae bacterium]
MASSGALADFGRMTAGRKVAVFVVIGGLLGFLYYRFAYKPLAADVQKAKSAMNASAAQNTQIDNDIPKYKKLLERKKKLDETIKEQQRALPTDAEIPAFFETLERKVTESGVEIKGFTRRPEENVESFVKVGMDVEINGTFLQIKRFFASLVEKKPKSRIPGEPDETEEQERIVSIENLVLGTPTVKNGQIVLTARFAAVTFRQEDAKPLPPTAPGAVPAGAPAPSGGSDVTPGPLPSAATPAGAKARVEDSMKKSDERTKEGTTDPAGSGSARLKGGL